MVHRLVALLVLMAAIPWSTLGRAQVKRATGSPAQESPALSPPPMPQLISRVEPQYPLSAKEKRFEALVILQVLIRKDGSVGTFNETCLQCQTKLARIIPGGRKEEELLCKSLCESSIRALKEWKYHPAKMADGTPTEVPWTIVLDFKLPQAEAKDKDKR